jgi:hypothetical protein
MSTMTDAAPMTGKVSAAMVRMMNPQSPFRAIHGLISDPILSTGVWFAMRKKSAGAGMPRPDQMIRADRAPSSSAPST